jgi:hypothetical protein
VVVAVVHIIEISICELAMLLELVALTFEKLTFTGDIRIETTIPCSLVAISSPPPLLPGRRSS